MTGVFVGLLLPAVAAWLAMTACGLRRAIDSSLLAAALAVCGGLGLASLSTMWLVAMGMTVGPALVAVDASLWTVVVAVAWWRLHRSRASAWWRPGRDRLLESRRATPTDRVVRVVFAVTAAIAVATAITEYAAASHGQWDAWAIWNQKARFLFRGGHGWTALLEVDWSNPSHPLLVPTSIARLWAYAGTESTTTPMLLGAVFGACIVAAVMAALDVNRPRAWIAGSVLLAPGTFVHHVMSQQTDVPFSFFMVATLIVLRTDRLAAWLDARAARAPLCAAGVLGGLAAWTKNEGLVLLVATTLLVAWVTIRRGHVREMAWWAGGVAPALLTLAWLKLTVAPVAPVYLPEASQTLAGFVGPERLAAVATLTWSHVATWGGPVAVGLLPVAVVSAAAVSVTHAGRTVRPVLAIVGIMLAVYFGVYLLTPLDLAWLVDTTIDRLLVHVWPTLILAVFLTSEEGAKVQ